MADQQQQGKGKGNPVFGANILGKFLDLRTAWDAVVVSHPEDAERINQQSAQDANQRLGTGGNGPLAAINAVITKVDDLLSKGDIVSEAANAARQVLTDLIEAVRKYREQETKDAGEKNKSGSTGGKSEKVQWTLPAPDSPVVHTIDEFWDNMPHKAQQHRQAQLNALSADDRAVIALRLTQGITKRQLGQLITRMAEE